MPADPSRVPGRRTAATAAGLDCAAAFQAMALGCVAAIKTHHRGACAGDAEAVHQIRVAITRLRAAVAFFKAIVVDKEWPRLKKEIGWLNGPLGAARDSDVVVEYARRKRYQAWAQRMIGAQLEQQQMRDHRRLVRALRSARTERLLAALLDWIREGLWLKRYRRSENREALRDYCTRELGRWHKRLVRKGRHLDRLGEAPRHRLRIKAKRFRYILEALKEAGAPRAQGEWKQLHGAAKQLQRSLGDLRDLTRFAELADGARADGGKSARKHPPGYGRRTEKLLDAAVTAHRNLKHADAR